MPGKLSRIRRKEDYDRANKAVYAQGFPPFRYHYKMNPYDEEKEPKRHERFRKYYETALFNYYFWDDTEYPEREGCLTIGKKVCLEKEKSALIPI